VVVDVLTDLLQRARATGTVFAVSTLRSPWGVALDADASITIHVALAGTTWVCLGSGTTPDTDAPGTAVELEAGDLAVVGPGLAHRVASGPRARCHTLAELEHHRVPGSTSTFDVPGDGRASTLLCGAYRLHGGLCDQLVARVPPITVLRAGEAPALEPLVAVLAHETRGSLPGRAVVLDRTVDVVFVELIRIWFDGIGERAPEWYRALADPDIGRALGVVHADPGRGWTVASWAREVGLARATLARRFQTVMGVAPMTYLTDWRMRVAAERLRDGDEPVGRIAHDLGYQSDAAFAAAFRKRHGTTPTAYRTTSRLAPAS
jgi:AraC-like DNA-binding protein